MTGTDLDRHPDDEAFSAFMADVDRIVARLLIVLVLLAVTGLLGLAISTP